MGWYEAIKDAIIVADRLRDIELKQRLADVQVECAKLAEENAKLRQELLDLREQAKTRQEMYYQNNVYWRLTVSLTDHSSRNALMETIRLQG